LLGQGGESIAEQCGKERGILKAKQVERKTVGETKASFVRSKDVHLATPPQTKPFAMTIIEKVRGEHWDSAKGSKSVWRKEKDLLAQTWRECWRKMEASVMRKQTKASQPRRTTIRSQMWGEVQEYSETRERWGTG